MSTVVLLLNQDGITELIQIANDLQNKIDSVMNTGQNQQKDRIADAGATTSTFLEVAKEKLPMILEEGNEEEGGKAISPAAAASKLDIYEIDVF